MSPTERHALIENALVTCSGNKVEAAKLLGWKHAKMASHIRMDPMLRAKWVKAQDKSTAPPPVNETALELSRPDSPLPPPEETTTTTDLELCAALDKEDAAVKAGLQTIGQSSKMAELARSLSVFHRKHFASALDLLGGGIVKQYLDMMSEVDKISAQLDEESDPFKQISLRQDRVALSGLMVKIYDRAVSASMTKAVIKHKLEEKNRKKNEEQPGYLKIRPKNGDRVVVALESGGGN